MKNSIHAFLFLFVFLGCGARPAPEPPPQNYPRVLSAAEFIAEAKAHEFDLINFQREFGLPVIKDTGDGPVILIFKCRDANARLSVDRAKFDRGTLLVITAEPI